jgi:hypothetical protein
MARIARSEVFDHTETKWIFTECTAAHGRLLAAQQSTPSAELDERSAFIKKVISHFRQYFAVKSIAYKFDDKSIKQLLQPQPHLAQQFSHEEVARRWLIICPSLRKYDAPLDQPSEIDVKRLCEDPDLIERIRDRLSDVAWWNRLLCQRVAQHFNACDNLRGRFWEGRFHSTLLLDHLSRIACLASIGFADYSGGKATTILEDVLAKSIQLHSNNVGQSATHTTGAESLSMLEWTFQSNLGSTDNDLQNIAISMFCQLGITATIWVPLVLDFRCHFSHIAGQLENMDRHVSRITRRKFFVRPQARRLLSRRSAA